MTSAPEEERRPLVLVVDDMMDSRDVSATILTASGYRAETARDGTEALMKAASLKPDAIVMDIAMPHLDGFLATRQLKRWPGTASIPVIALTGFVTPGDRGKCIEAGCAGFLAKPCRPEQLVGEVRRVLKGRSAPE